MSKMWEEEAKYHEAHRNDPGEWGDPVEAPVVAPRNGLAISITVRFSPREAEAIRHTADIEGKNYSEVVRTAVHRYTQPDTVSLSAGSISLTGIGAHVSRTQRDAAPSSVDISGTHTDAHTVSSGAAIAAR